jgi:hypothetical protein
MRRSGVSFQLAEVQISAEVQIRKLEAYATDPGMTLRPGCGEPGQ